MSTPPPPYFGKAPSTAALLDMDTAESATYLSQIASAYRVESGGSKSTPHSLKTTSFYRTRANKLMQYADSIKFNSKGKLAAALMHVVPREYGDWLSDQGMASVVSYVDTVGVMYNTMHRTYDLGNLKRGREWNEEREHRSKKTAEAPKRDRTYRVGGDDDGSVTDGGIRPTPQRLREIAQIYGMAGKDKAGFAYAAIQAYGPPLRNADFDMLKVNPVRGQLNEELGNNIWVDEFNNVHVHLAVHKTAAQIGKRNHMLDPAQSEQVLSSLMYNQPSPTTFREWYTQTAAGEGVKKMTRVIDTNLQAKSFAQNMDGDIRLYGCNTYRRNMADTLISSELEKDLALFAEVSKRISASTKDLFNVALKMGSSGGVLLTEYRKGDVAWTVESKAAVQLLLSRAHGGINQN